MSAMPSPSIGHGARSLLLQIVAETSAPVLALESVTDAGRPESPTCEVVGNVGVTARPAQACALAGTSAMHASAAMIVGFVREVRDLIMHRRYVRSRPVPTAHCRMPLRTTCRPLAGFPQTPIESRRARRRAQLGPARDR